MSDPIVAQKSPYEVQVEVGESYWWSACGKSKEQPFCDGSHKGTGFSPIEYKCTESGTQYFCGCKYIKDTPMCDGAHKGV
ncbi:CDGSH iron-sulfur domain-containing protein [Alphaproteobacteria bacterium]|jgi:CDGSH-type Zn-finger protein|nr:CDGSH iron-sulfur domain-containing protein [Alphaproteobacteria bacterium]